MLFVRAVVNAQQRPATRRQATPVAVLLLLQTNASAQIITVIEAVHSSTAAVPKAARLAGEGEALRSMSLCLDAQLCRSLHSLQPLQCYRARLDPHLRLASPNCTQASTPSPPPSTAHPPAVGCAGGRWRGCRAITARGSSIRRGVGGSALRESRWTLRPWALESGARGRGRPRNTPLGHTSISMGCGASQ